MSTDERSLYCLECGAEIPPNFNHCQKCGEKNRPETREEAGFTPIGYSSRINSPEFGNYQKKFKKGSFIFTIILAVLALVGIPVYGGISGDIDFPYSIYYGAGIGGLILVMAFFQNLKGRLDTTWDGEVIDKTTRRRSKFEHEDDPGTTYTEYIIKVKRDGGKVYQNNLSSGTGVYEYFQKGDRVRHHKGLSFYEKYDKSRDNTIICVACGNLNQIKNDVCTRCKCPLLK